MLVEFTGLPGAGKTTLERLLLKKLKAEGSAPLQRAEVIQSAIRRWLPAYPDTPLRKLGTAMYLTRLYSKAFNARMSTGLFRGGLGAKRNLPFKWMAEDVLLANHFQSISTTNLFFPSEGFQQHLAAAAVWCGHMAWDMAKYFSFPHCKRKVIHVITDRQTALQRMAHRGTPETWPQTKHNNATILSKFEMCIERSLSHAHEVGTTIISVKNTSDINYLEEKANSLATCIGDEK